MTNPNSGIPLSEWSGSGATRELRETISSFNEQASRHTEVIIRLTKVLVWLTAIMTLGLGIQILLTLRQLNWL